MLLVPSYSFSLISKARLIYDLNRIYGRFTGGRISLKNVKEAITKPELREKPEFKNIFLNPFVQKLQDLKSDFLTLHKLFLDQLILKYLAEYTLKTPRINLYIQLIQSVDLSVQLYAQVSQKLEEISGIYLIYHQITEIASIGHSQNILRRFDQHKQFLLMGIHHNENMQKAFDFDRTQNEKVNQTLYSLDHFIFLFLEVDLLTIAEREDRETELIQSWEGKLDNISKNSKNK